jgi:hypothetical protein
MDREGMGLDEHQNLAHNIHNLFAIILCRTCTTIQYNRALAKFGFAIQNLTLEEVYEGITI